MRQAAIALLLAAMTCLLACPALSADLPKPADIELHFVPRTAFATYIPSVVDGNIGYFAAYWNSSGEITRAVALVSTDADQAERIHCIREEITQALGPMKDSYWYPDSMFYQPWSLTSRFSEMDKAIVHALYRPEVRPDMSEAEVRQALKGICTPEQINYLVEICCGAEYAQCDELIHKWMHGPTIHVTGELTEVDVRTVYQVVGDLNGLLGKIKLKVSGWDIQARKPEGKENTTAVAAVKPKAKPSPKEQSQPVAGGRQKTS